MKLRNHSVGLSIIACAMLLSGTTLAQDTTTSTTTTTTPPAPMTSPMQPATTDTATPTTPAVVTATVDHAAEQQRIQDLVKSAADYIKQKGKDVAIAEFNKKEGAFTKGNSYIFAVDYTGMSLADMNNPELVGKNQYDLKSDDGKLIVQDAIAKAKAGGGWIQYRWKEPTSQAVSCKKSYVMGINNTYLIGSGYYYPANSDGSCAP